MNKTFKTYIAVWAVLLVLFNILAFVPENIIGHDKYTASFWIGYVFITLAFLGQLACSYLTFKEEKNITKIFYNISIFRAGYTGLIVSAIAGGVCMVVSFIPYWVSVVVCAVVLGLNIIAVVKATVAVETVSAVDDKIKVKTYVIKSLTAEAQTLVQRGTNDEMKSELTKIYDALRYSDPMSNDLLSGEEMKIKTSFSELSSAVNSGNTDDVKSISKELLILIQDRNNKCRLLKIVSNDL